MIVSHSLISLKVLDGQGEKKLSRASYGAVTPLRFSQNSLSLKTARISVGRLRIIMLARKGHRSPYLRKLRRKIRIGSWSVSSCLL